MFDIDEMGRCTPEQSFLDHFVKRVDWFVIGQNKMCMSSSSNMCFSSPENIAAVAPNVFERPSTSFCHRSHEPRNISLMPFHTISSLNGLLLKNCPYR